MAEGTLAKPREGVAKMAEVSGSTGQLGGEKGFKPGGIYRHPQTGEEIIALDDPITGDAQARGFTRVGYEFVRPVKPGDVKEVGITPSESHAAQPERKVEADSEELKGLRARLAVLEAADAKRAEEANKPEATSPTEESQQHTQDDATQKTEERGTDNSGHVVDNGGVNASQDENKVTTRRGRPAKSTEGNE